MFLIQIALSHNDLKKFEEISRLIDQFQSSQMTSLLPGEKVGQPRRRCLRCCRSLIFLLVDSSRKKLLFLFLFFFFIIVVIVIIIIIIMIVIITIITITIIVIVIVIIIIISFCNNNDYNQQYIYSFSN